MGCVLLCLVALLAGHVKAEGGEKGGRQGHGKILNRPMRACVWNSSSGYFSVCVCPQFQTVIEAISLKLLHFLPVYTIQTEASFVE